MSSDQVQPSLTELLSGAGMTNCDSAKKDVLKALAQFKDLSPCIESFLFPDGKRQTAFCLKGTIPVYYKQREFYNIPVTVYLLDTHPFYAPICYVNPTATMVIKESEHVNKEGKVLLSYLDNWRFPGYDLSGLLQMMAMVFQEKCPVYALPSANASSTPTPYPTGSGATPYPNSGMRYNPYMNVPQPTPYSMDAGGSMDAFRASYMSAVEQKLREKLRERMGTNSAEMASIKTTGGELRDGQQKLKKMVEELESQRNALQTACEIYTAKKAELAKALADAGGTDAPPIDEAVDAAFPLHRQIVLNYVKDLTCDDVIYTLGQSLKKNKITTSEYLRQIRDVSREQFIHRATMQKCRRTAGLPI